MCVFVVMFKDCQGLFASLFERRFIFLYIFIIFALLLCCRAHPVEVSKAAGKSKGRNSSQQDVKNQKGNFLTKLTYDAIKPPDHLNGVKMERDGHLNKQFRKEVLIGSPEKDKLDNDDLLTDIFSKADLNKDSYLSQDELETWIAQKVKEHFVKAVRENFYIFTSLDKDHNGRVSWDEYHISFMMEQGFNETYAKKHPENHKSLKRKVKEKILLDKAAWSEAANSDPDALNIDEFLTFRHPEHSHVSLLNMVNDIIDSLDTDGDEVLTEDEFAEMPDSDETNRTSAERKLDRIREFHESIDVNRDGVVNRQELLMYNDPENPIHSTIEAKKLMLLADVNRDGRLSLQEMLAKKDSFLGSKMVDSARSFHDEF